MAEPVRIVVDLHERSGRAAFRRCCACSAEVDIAPLQAGDYACGVDTIAAFVAAGPEEWRKVPGVGPERIQALCEAFSVLLPERARRPAARCPRGR